MTSLLSVSGLRIFMEQFTRQFQFLSREFAFDGPCGVEYTKRWQTFDSLHLRHLTRHENATSHVCAHAVGQVPGLLPNLVTRQRRRLGSFIKITAAIGMLSSC